MCETLLHYLHDGRRCSRLRFPDQQVKVLGHDYVTDDPEAILLSRFFQDFQKPVELGRASQIWPARMTATGNEMEVSVAVVTMKAVGHWRTLLQKYIERIVLRRKKLL